jgi:hypothetical protein
VEDERVAGAGREVADLAGDDHVVAGGDHVAQVAADPEQGVVDRRDPVPLAPGDPLPLLRHRRLGREGPRDLLLAGVEDADAEAVGGLDREQGAGAAVESRQASISIGSIESELTAFAVAPAGPSAPLAATIVTPVGSAAIAARKLAGSGGGIVRRS